MAEEQKLNQEIKPPEPTEIEVGGKKYDAKKAAETLENRQRFETEYHEGQRKLHEAQEELKALKDAQKPKEEPPAGKKLSQIPFDSEEFIPTLVRTLESVDERITRLMGDQENEVKSEMQKIANNNRGLLEKFSTENELSADERERVMRLAINSDHNDVRYGGRTAVISPLALEDALIVVRKDRIIARSKQEGKEQTISQLFGKQTPEPKPDANKAPDEVNMAWLADNWHKLTDEQRQKYRKAGLYPGGK